METWTLRDATYGNPNLPTDLRKGRRGVLRAILVYLSIFFKHLSSFVPHHANCTILAPRSKWSVIYTDRELISQTQNLSDEGLVAGSFGAVIIARSRAAVP